MLSLTTTKTAAITALSMARLIYAAPSVKRQEDDAPGKAGLAWSNADSVEMDQFTSTGKVTWYYTWSAWPTDVGRDLEWVPMFWGEKSVEDWENNLPTLIEPRLESGDVKNILGFNEPQDVGQSNFSPEDAKELWMEYLHPLKEEYGVRLGSPAPSSAPNGKTWVQDFLDVCGDDCEVDFVALHWYGTNATHFIEYIEDFHETFDLPIWVTEWACHDFTGQFEQCSDQDVIDFMNRTQSYMDAADWVERYSWFGAMPEPVVHESNSIMNSEGEINALGEQYIGLGTAEITSSASESGTASVTTPRTRSTSPTNSILLSSDGEGPQDGDWLSIGQSSMASPVQSPVVSFSTLGRATSSLALVVLVTIVAFY